MRRKIIVIQRNNCKILDEFVNQFEGHEIVFNPLLITQRNIDNFSYCVCVLIPFEKN